MVELKYIYQFHRQNCIFNYQTGLNIDFKLTVISTFPSSPNNYYIYNHCNSCYIHFFDTNEYYQLLYENIIALWKDPKFCLLLTSSKLYILFYINFINCIQ
jgi:hypothetical protein